MSKIRGVLLILLVPVFLISCVSNMAKDLSDIAAEDRVQNKEIALSRGERVFDVPSITVIKAFITAFSQLNMAVINLDKEVGYILAEGEMPLNPEKVKEIGMANVDRLSKRTGIKWVYVGNNMEVRVTVNLLEKKKNVITIKMGLSSQVTNKQTAIRNNELPPSFTNAIYTSLWAEFDKQLFILQGTE